MTGASLARSVRTSITIYLQQKYYLTTLTVTFRASSVNTGTSHEYIMYNRKDTFATHPSPISVLDLAIVERGRLVHLNAPAMYSSGEWDLIWMKIVPT